MYRAFFNGTSYFIFFLKKSEEQKVHVHKAENKSEGEIKSQYLKVDLIWLNLLSVSKKNKRIMLQWTKRH